MFSGIRHRAKRCPECGAPGPAFRSQGKLFCDEECAVTWWRFGQGW
jgi:uncharacterized Zn finger protein (UPF0148 family)